MTLDEWFNKFFSPEYLNVQDKEAWKAMAQQELQEVLNSPATPAE